MDEKQKAFMSEEEVQALVDKALDDETLDNQYKMGALRARLHEMDSQQVREFMLRQMGEISHTLSFLCPGCMDEDGGDAKELVDALIRLLA